MAQQRQSLLTFPTLEPREIIDILENVLGLNYSVNEILKPSPQLVARVYSDFLTITTGISREDVGRIVKEALEALEYPEYYREALSQLTLLREMQVLCEAASLSGIETFRLDDIVNPTRDRFQKVLSAILNYGRFREDVLRRHAEQTEGFFKMERELKTLCECEGGLQEQIKLARERLAKEAPERERLLLEKDHEESILRRLNIERTGLERSREEEKKKLQEIKTKCDRIQFEITSIENEVSDIRSQLVSSPERIQAEQQRLKRKLELEKEELEQIKEKENKQTSSLDSLRQANEDLERYFAFVTQVEDQVNQATKEENSTKARSDNIDSHAYHMKELHQKEQEAQQELELAIQRNNRLKSKR